MKELLAQLTATLRGMWRKRWQGLLVAWIVGAIGALMVLRTPDKFEATARVYVDTKTVLRPLMRDLAVDLDLEQTVSLLSRTLITRPNVEQLMRKSHFDLESKSIVQREQMIDSLIQEIKLTGSGRDSVFSFSYRNQDPERAKLLIQNLVSLFVESDRGSKRRDTESAKTFIDEQIKGYESRLAEAEDRLKAFKLRNLGMLEGQGKDYFGRISTVTEEFGKLAVELRAAEQSRDAMRRELDGEKLTLVPDTPAANAVIASEFDARLEVQRRQLDELLRRYTDIHPDVMVTKRLIARLEDQRQQDVEAKRLAAAARPASRAATSDPVYQRIRLAFAEAEANVAAVRVRADDARSKLELLRASASRVPQIEAELAQLNRDYEVVRKNYDALVAQREKASISEDVDATRPAQFRVIDPPRASSNPVFPNRMVITPLVLILAIVAGLAGSFVVSQLRPVFDSVQALRELTQRPVLGAVSLVKSGVNWQDRQQAFAFGSAAIGLVAVFVGWTAWMAVLSRA